MSDNGETNLISPSNLQTVVAVAFVLALLSVGFNFYNFTRINGLFSGLLQVNDINVEAINSGNAHRDKRIQGLEDKVGKLRDDIKGMKEKAKLQRMREKEMKAKQKAKGNKGP